LDDVSDDVLPYIYIIVENKIMLAIPLLHLQSPYVFPLKTLNWQNVGKLYANEKAPTK
jgi:hypothetical protein